MAFDLTTALGGGGGGGGSSLYRVHYFDSSTTYSPTQDCTALVYVIGAGGSGGQFPGGGYTFGTATGGGAGGIAISILTLSASTTYTITIGAGGDNLSYFYSTRQGTAGGSTSFSGTGITTMTANGGGGGAAGFSVTGPRSGGAGGSATGGNYVNYSGGNGGDADNNHVYARLGTGGGGVNLYGDVARASGTDSVGFGNIIAGYTGGGNWEDQVGHNAGTPDGLLTLLISEGQNGNAANTGKASAYSTEATGRFSGSSGISKVLNTYPFVGGKGSGGGGNYGAENGGYPVKGGNGGDGVVIVVELLNAS